MQALLPQRVEEDGPSGDCVVRRVRAEVAARLRQPPAGSGRGQVHQGGDHCHGLVIVPYYCLSHSLLSFIDFNFINDVRIDGLRLVFHLLGQGQYTFDSFPYIHKLHNSLGLLDLATNINDKLHPHC